MAHHTKNLLEAFQASAALEKSAAASDPQASAPRAGGPFAAQVQRTAPPPGPEPDPLELEGEPAEEPFRLASLGPRRLQRLAVLQVLLLAAAFLLGRVSAPATAAAADGGPAAKSAPGAPAKAGLSSVPPVSPAVERRPDSSGLASARSPAELAPMDGKNKYTVCVVQYDKGAGDALAAATRQYLVDQGLPACVTFLGKTSFVVVGAAPTSGELDALVQRARTLKGPPPRNKAAEFSDAYVVPIDKVLHRVFPE